MSEINGDQIRDRLDRGAAKLEAGAKAASTLMGEGAVTTIPPISEEARDELRTPEPVGVSRYRHMAYGPNGQMITSNSR